MNFQAVNQANGKNVAIWATLTTWEGLAFTTNQAKYLSCKLVDDNGVEHKCRIYEGKGALPGQENLNKRLQFNLSSYKGTTQTGQSYTGYSGFWSHGATSRTSQDSPQSPQNDPGATNSPRQGNNDVEIRKCVVCAYISNGTSPLVEDIEYWMEYIKTGIDASLPNNRTSENRQAQDEDIPSW